MVCIVGEIHSKLDFCELGGAQSFQKFSQFESIYSYICIKHNVMESLVYQDERGSI